MAVIIGSARLGENGKITGGKSGDQTGSEVSTQNYYVHSKGWRVLRAKDPAARKKIAAAMKAACNNNNIGYDQNSRNSLYSLASKVGFDVSKVTTKCETDCSALVRVCCAYAGIMVSDFITSNEASTLLASGAFTELTGDKYTKQSAYLAEGDILVTKSKGHTVVVLTSGAKVEVGSAPAVPETPAKPSESGYIVKVTGASVNIRSGPGTQYTAIVQVNKGDVLEVPDASGWTPVKYGGHVYWISEKYSDMVKE